MTVLSREAISKKYKEYAKEHRKKNIEKIKKREKKYREENKEYQKESQKRYRKQNQEYQKEYQKRYRKQNQEINKGKIMTQINNNENPLLSIRKKLQLSLKDFGLLTGVYFLRILEVEKGHLESIPLKLIDSLLELKLIHSKEEFLLDYEKFITKKLIDLKERALNKDLA